MNTKEIINKIEKTKSLVTKQKLLEKVVSSDEINYYQKLQILNIILEQHQNKYNRLLTIEKLFALKETNKTLKTIIVKENEEKQLFNIINSIKQNLISKMNKEYIIVPKLNYYQIKELDRFIEYDTYKLIEKLYNTNGINARLEILEELKIIYETKISEYRSIKNEQYKKTFYKQIRYLKIMIEFVNGSIKNEHNRQNISIKKEQSNEEIQEHTDLEKTNLSVLTSNNKDNIKIEKLLQAYKYILINSALEHSKIILQNTKYLTNRILENEIVDDEVIIELNSINDVIKYRLLKLDKDKDVLERKLLKELRIAFYFIMSNYEENKEKTKHNYNYDVIFYFLNSEEGYPYIKKILENNSSIYNTRKVLPNGDTEHIIISILKEFISNHKKMLQNKKNEFINPDYLEQVYYLFSHSYEVTLTKEERIQIDTIIDEYKEYIKNNMHNLDRKKAAKKELDNLKTNKYYLPRILNYKNINENQLYWQIPYIKENKKISLNKHNRVNLTKESTISFNDNTAYSLIEEENSKTLKIHALDLSCMIVPNTSVDSYIYNCMIANEEIDDLVKTNFKFSYNKENPCITYEIKLNKNNIVESFNIYKSIVNVEQKCNDVDLFYKRNVQLNALGNLSKKIYLINNMELEHIDIPSIENAITILLNEQFINYIEENNIPFIYGGVEYINDFVNQLNDLNYTFSRLDKKDFKKLYEIINNNVGEFGYHTKLFESQEPYYMHLINSDDYLTIFNQRLINDIIINEEEIKTREYYLKEVEKLKHELNLSIGYLPIEDIKFKNTRQRNKLKEYNIYY